MPTQIEASKETKTVFEEFEHDFGKTVEGLGLMPGAKCFKVSMMFIDDDGATTEIAATRSGFAEDGSRLAGEDES